MLCSHPTVFKNSSIPLPCGQCLNCRINRRTEITTKIFLEWLYYHKKAVFLTLTYAPEHLPYADTIQGGVVMKSHLQNFLKRFRYYFGDREMKYFAVGEYGEKSKRAHYHAILFNVSESEAREIAPKAWKLGFIMYGSLQGELLPAFNRMKYTAKYTVKKLFNFKDDLYSDGRLEEFTLMSRKPALGSRSLGSFVKYLDKHNLVPFQVFDSFQRWTIKEELQKRKFKPFYGYFKVGNNNFKLDRVLLNKLAKLMYPELFSDLEEECEKVIVRPRDFKRYRSMLDDFKSLQFLKGEKQDAIFEAKKKEEKETRAWYSKVRYNQI